MSPWLEVARSGSTLRNRPIAGSYARPRMFTIPESDSRPAKPMGLDVVSAGAQLSVRVNGQVIERMLVLCFGKSEPM